MNKRLRFVVTAGPTREHIDPVRYLSNPSTGKMGFAIAAAAAAAGHETALVSGPSALKTPRGVTRIDVVSARDMMKAVRALDGPNAVLVAAAAVADWRPAKRAARKLRKAEIGGVLHLVRNPDVLKSARFPLKVGFAAQTHDIVAEAARKCREKRLAFVVANDVTEKGCGFGTDTNRVAIVRADGSATRLPMASKAAVARRIVRECENLRP